MNKINNVSFVIPVYNEKENIPDFHNDLMQVVNHYISQDTQYKYEIIYVNDGSTDGSQEVLQSLSNDHIKLVNIKINSGKSYALQKGFSLAQYETVIMMDSDRQDIPNELLKLITEKEKGFNVVSGYKQRRKDALIKVISSRLSNKFMSLLFKTSIKDFNSGLKVMDKDFAKSLILPEGFHRFIAFFAINAGLSYKEVPVEHRPRVHGKSKYSVFKIIPSSLDLLLLFFTIHRYDLLTIAFVFINLLIVIAMLLIGVLLNLSLNNIILGIIVTCNAVITYTLLKKIKEYKTLAKSII